MESEDHLFWMDRYEILWEYPEEWIPEMYLPPNRRRNAFVRASIYLGLILLLFTGSVNMLLLPLIVMVVTGVTRGMDSKDKKEQEENKVGKEGFVVGLGDKPHYIEPSIDNPYMNPLLTDYLTQPNREAVNKAPGVDQNMISSVSKAAFDENLFRDVSDVYDKMNSQRQFYQVPNTRIPNDQTEFAKWLYGTPPTCKEGNGFQCVANNYDSPRFGSREVILA